MDTNVDLGTLVYLMFRVSHQYTITERTTKTHIGNLNCSIKINPFKMKNRIYRSLNNKYALYESIMTRVAREVKRALNENALLDDLRCHGRKSIKSKRHINEANDWTIEDNDWVVVNDEEDGDGLYAVKIWSGSGYDLNAYKAYAFDEDDALDKVVVYLEKNDS